MDNSLTNQSKASLAKQLEALVFNLMDLWGQEHKMASWVDPLHALFVLRTEATARRRRESGEDPQVVSLPEVPLPQG